LGSKAQKEVLSGVEPRLESEEGRDCLRLSERTKRKIVYGKKNNNKKVTVEKKEFIRYQIE
jgi:hypothetical protein